MVPFTFHADDGLDAYHAWALVVLGMRDGKLREIATFASPELFARFGLPAALEADDK